MNMEDINRLGDAIDHIAKKELREIANQINMPIIEHLQRTLDMLMAEDPNRGIYDSAIQFMRDYDRGIFKIADLMNVPNLTVDMISSIENMLNTPANQAIQEAYDQTEKKFLEGINTTGKQGQGETSTDANKEVTGMNIDTNQNMGGLGQEGGDASNIRAGGQDNQQDTSINTDQAAPKEEQLGDMNRFTSSNTDQKDQQAENAFSE